MYVCMYMVQQKSRQGNQWTRIEGHSDRSAQLWSAAALTKGQNDSFFRRKCWKNLENCVDKNETRYPYVTLHKSQTKRIKDFQIRFAGLK